MGNSDFEIAEMIYFDYDIGDSNIEMVKTYLIQKYFSTIQFPLWSSNANGLSQNGRGLTEWKYTQGYHNDNTTWFNRTPTTSTWSNNINKGDEGSNYSYMDWIYYTCC